MCVIFIVGEIVPIHGNFWTFKITIITVCWGITPCNTEKVELTSIFCLWLHSHCTKNNFHNIMWKLLQWGGGGGSQGLTLHFANIAL